LVPPERGTRRKGAARNCASFTWEKRKKPV